MMVETYSGHLACKLAFASGHWSSNMRRPFWRRFRRWLWRWQHVRTLVLLPQRPNSATELTTVGSNDQGFGFGRN